MISFILYAPVSGRCFTPIGNLEDVSSETDTRSMHITLLLSIPSIHDLVCLDVSIKAASMVKRGLKVNRVSQYDSEISRLVALQTPVFLFLRLWKRWMVFKIRKRLIATAL